MRKTKMKKQYQSWFRRDKKVNKKLYEAAKKDRKGWRNKRIEEIKEIIIDNDFEIKKRKMKNDIITFLSPEYMDLIHIKELASGLRLEIESGFGELEDEIIGITNYQMRKIIDWAESNLEEVSLY